MVADDSERRPQNQHEDQDREHYAPSWLPVRHFGGILDRNLLVSIPIRLILLAREAIAHKSSPFCPRIGQSSLFMSTADSGVTSVPERDGFRRFLFLKVAAICIFSATNPHPLGLRGDQPSSYPRSLRGSWELRFVSLQSCCDWMAQGAVCTFSRYGLFGSRPDPRYARCP